MPDRSKRRKKNKNKRKNKSPSNAETAKVDAGISDDEIPSVDEKCDVDETSVCASSSTQSDSKPVYSEITQVLCDSKPNESCKQNNQKICGCESVNYIVESPGQMKNSVKTNLSEIPKSKSLDDGDAPKIIEITDESDPNLDLVAGLIVVDNALVSEAESDVEWERADALTDEIIPSKSAKAVSTLSINTLSTNIAECEHTQALSPEEELSLRQYLQTLNLVTCPQQVETIEVEKFEEHICRDQHVNSPKLRKKAIYEEAVKPKQRFLDVIDEEGSNASSLDSRRQSDLKDDCDDLEDEVFHEKNKRIEPLEKFPLPKSARPQRKSNLIPQECLLVGTKMLQQKIDEGRGDCTVQNIGQMKGAELVYLTDSSSSASDIHDIGEEPDFEEIDESDVHIITPTIEINNSINFTNNSVPDKPNNGTFISTPPCSPKTNISDEYIVEDVGESNSTQDKESKVIEVLSTENRNPSIYVLKTKEEMYQQSENVTKNTFTLSPELNFGLECPEGLSIENAKSQNTEFKLVGQKTKIYNEINDLKVELNNAISNLMKEVATEKDNIATKENVLLRQDSSSSLGSSQCTAKYNPTATSLTDIATLVHDTTGPSKPDIHSTYVTREYPKHIESHVKDVFERVSGSVREQQTISHDIAQDSIRLKDICLRRIASLPYGEQILEELASVSERLQQTDICEQPGKISTIMPFYPLPDISTIKKVSLLTKNLNVPSNKPLPPPVAPRNSSLKIPHDELSWTGVPTNSDPNLYVCLSPSQKMLMEKTNTVLEKEDASELLNSHQKYVDRRGYNEVYSRNIRTKYNDLQSEAMPFKSQTGNRLLAIIRDPAVNANSKINKWNNCRENLQYSSSSSNIHKEAERFKPRCSNSARDVRTEMSFRPIPPPRPRKYSSALYESDESSDYTDHSFQSVSERKYFHYSTGNLNKEIEKDVSSIQNMHRKYTTARNNFKDNYLISFEPLRRPSLPKDLCEQQMDYISQKEKEVDAEIQRINTEKSYLFRPEMKCLRAPLYCKSDVTEENRFDDKNYHISRKRDIAIHSDNKSKGSSQNQMSRSFKSSQEEIMRDKMYSEYMCQMAEREERKQHKVIKITTKPLTNDLKIAASSLPVLQINNEFRIGNNPIEEEFISKAKQRWDKLGIKDPETEDEIERKNEYREPKIVEHKIKVIEGGEEKDVQRLPKHLREFVQFTAKGDKEAAASPAVWSPGGGAAAAPPAAPPPRSAPAASAPRPPPPPVWKPSSAGPSPQAQRKLRPVQFEDTADSCVENGRDPCAAQAWESAPALSSDAPPRLPTSHSAPPGGLGSLGGGGRSARVHNPTVTPFHKNREQLGPSQEQRRQLPRDRPTPPSNDPVHALRRGYASESETDRVWDREGKCGRLAAGMGDGEKKVEGIGPTTKEGMPVALRSEVKDPSRWYKKMYETIHKSKYDDDSVTIRYKVRRGEPSIHKSGNRSQYAYFDPRSGYLSEPEGGAGRGGATWSDYESDVGQRRRTTSVQGEQREEETPFMPSNKYSTLASAKASHEVYKNQPGKIENYMPGRSSIVDKETKQWWDEVMDIFDGQISSTSTNSLQQPSPKEKKDVTSAILSKSNMARALKESGYESDSTLVFRRRPDETEPPLSPAERRAAYRDLQAGGEPPLRGFRSPAPPRHQEPDSAPDPLPKRSTHSSYSDTESPRRYLEGDVNIHYRCPVRRDPLPHVPERELARRQAEHMRRLYQEERRRKYLQELQDMQSRRHTDNFTPSQKTILPLNRYDEHDTTGGANKRIYARALYAFVGQNSRELNFRKGDIISVRRQIDANWYEGELNGKIGLFPYNYVEIVKGDNAYTKPSPATEGKARAKFDFTAQTSLELPLKKGEVVVLSRRIDQNWWEGRNGGGKTGIFPDSYVQVLQEPSQNKPELPPPQNSKPLASPASHGLLSGSAKQSMGAHSYQPQMNSASLSNGPQPSQPLTGTYSANFHAKPAQATLTPSERGYGPPSSPGVDLNNHEPLYIDTNAEAVPYRAMYKYRPQNPDELELQEGDTVYVLEKCDDGWYVGSSQRTGTFGTFPGNYVERI